MNINPEFDSNYINLGDCYVYVDGKYIGKADVLVPAVEHIYITPPIPAEDIEVNFEFDISAFKKLFEDT